MGNINVRVKFSEKKKYELKKNEQAKVLKVDQASFLFFLLLE